MYIVDRKTKKEREMTYDKSVSFLYQNALGRIVLKLLNNHFTSSLVGTYMNSRFSKKRIKKTIMQNKIDMSIYEDKDYASFNDFFTRRKKNLNFDMDKNHFVSPSDAKLLVKKLDKNVAFDIKGSMYHINDIVGDNILSDYQNGYALIFRLEITDYHRYHFIDNGTIDEYKFIKGKLHTVQPIAYEKYKVFHTNSREYTVLHTENFNDIVMCEVGAMMVGKITNYKNVKTFKKGDEKGYFEFGGSTIILFVKDNIIKIDDDILKNSQKGKETIVSCGEKIGVAVKK